MTGCRLQGWIASTAFWGLAFALPPWAWAQFNIPRPAEPVDSPEIVHAQQMPRDYRTQALLTDLERFLAQGPETFENAAEALQQLLDQPYDFFLLKDFQIDGGLRVRIDQIMAHAPAGFRDLYDRRFDSEARKLYEAAMQSGREAGLTDILRRFAWTTTGRRTMETLALSYADRGEILRAARMLEQLLSVPEVTQSRPELSLLVARYWQASGNVQARNAALANLKTAFPESISLNGQPVRMFEEIDQAGEWLKTVTGPPAPVSKPVELVAWTQPRGGEAGPASASAAAPLATDAWKGLLLDGFDVDPIFPNEPSVLANVKALQEKLEALEQKFIGQDFLKRPLAPTGTPLSIDGTVIVSGPASLKAYDARTGRFRWTTVEVDGTFQTLNRLNVKTDGSLVHNRLLDAFLAQRAWVNRTAGNVTSDGRYVYAIVDTGVMVSPRAMPFGPMIARNTPLPRTDNRLVAFDLATEGTIRWSMGGRAAPPAAATLSPAEVSETEADHPPGLAGVYFLGPPLPADDVLYVLGEDRGQVNLFALERQPATPQGAVLWSLPLLNPTPGSSLLDNVGRRMGGLTPVMEGGLLVCGLADGVVTTIDPARRQVVWSRRYRDVEAPLNRNLQFMQAVSAGHSGEDIVVQEQMKGIGWWDGNPIIAGSAVLLTPADDDRIHGFDLETGEPLWEPQPRGEGLYIAAADGDRVVVVEHRAVEARETSTWKSLWRRPLEAPGISGRGLRQRDRLTLPVGSGELMTIDLQAGEILARSPMPAGVRSANVIAAGGQVVLQTATHLYGYRSLDDVSRQIADELAKNPEGARALADRGALSLHQGDSASGQRDLRAALAVQDLPDARRLLVWSLLTELRTDFTRGEKNIEEIRRLARDPDQQFWLHLATAEGMQAAGKPADALREYLQIPMHAGMEDLEANLSVSNHRWVRGRIQELRDSATSREQLDAATGNWLKDLTLREPASKVLAALDRVGLNTPAEAAVLALPDPDKDFVAQRRLEHALWWIVTHGRAEARPAAAAKLAEMRLKRGQAEPVSDLLDDLGSKWAKTEVMNGKTGEQLLQAWESDPALNGALHLRPRWETSRIEVDAPAEASIEGRFSPVLVRGPTAGPLDGSLFSISGDGQTLASRDRFGSDTRLSVATGIEPGHGLFSSRYAATIGRMIVYVSLDRFLIVDSATSETVVNESLVEVNQSQFSGQVRGRAVMPDELREGIRTPLIPGPTGASYSGNVGQPTFDSLCYQRGDQLFCIHPATGELHWTRSHLPEGCEILMDDEYVVLSPPLTQELLVFRTADGRGAGRASVPRDVVRSRRGTEWGRLMLVATPGEPTIRYAMFDPATAKPVWQRDFAAQTEWTSADGEHIAFLTPAGDFEIVDFRTGNTLFKTAFGPIPKLDGFVVRNDGHRYGVFTWTYGNPGFRGKTEKADPRRREAHPQSLFRHFESYLRTEFSGPLFLVEHGGRKVWQRDAAGYRSLIVSNNCPPRWPVLLVLEEKDQMSKNWSATVDVVDVRQGTTVQSQELTKLRNKEYFPWKTEALNRLSVEHSTNVFDIRIIDPTRPTDAPDAKPPGEKPRPPSLPPPQVEPIREL